MQHAHLQRTVIGFLACGLAVGATIVPANAQKLALTDAEIRQRIIQASIAAYTGSCPCPYNMDRAGRRCGGRSAYSRAGGASPLCYPGDVAADEVERYRERLQ